MDVNKYKPRPADTSGETLPQELMELAERLAKNVHEVWAKKRMEQGWVYGPERNDDEKKHPCLIPYEQLSEVEKDYDRNTALETLKYIKKSGFELVKKNIS